MKKTKHFLSVFMLAVLLALCMFAMASCGDDGHTHEYTDDVTAPTCSQKGYTTHTCECGDSYVDSYVDKLAHDYGYAVVEEASCTKEGKGTYTCKVCGDSYDEAIGFAHDIVKHDAQAPTCLPGWEAYEECTLCDYTTYKEIAATGSHDYESKVSRFPTTLIPGVEKLHCVNCGEDVLETIDVVSISLPSISQALVEILGECHYELEVGEDTTFTYVKDCEDYIYVNGRKSSVAINIANAVVDVTDSYITGNIEIEFGVVHYSIDDDGDDMTFSEVFAISATLDGDALILELTENDDAMSEMDIDITEMFYSSIADMFGLSYDQLVEAIYVSGQLINYAPIIEDVADMISDFEINIPEADLSFIISAIQEKVFKATDDGDKVKVNLDITALTELIETLSDKSGAEIVNALYGEGTMEAISTYMKKLPNMTVMQIADSAILLAENYGIDVDDVYSLVNYVVYMTFDIDFDIEQQIVDRYDMTLAELVGEMLVISGADMTAEQVEESISSTIDGILTLVSESTLDALYNTLVGESESDDTFVSDSLESIVSMLSQMLEMDMVLDGDGNVEEINVKLNVPDSDDIDLNYVVTTDGFVITVVSGNYTSTVVGSDEGIDFDVTYRNSEIISGYIIEVDNGISLVGKFDVDGILGELVLEYRDDGYNFILNFDDQTIADIGMAFEDGKIAGLHAEAYIPHIFDNGMSHEVARELILYLDYVNDSEMFGFDLQTKDLHVFFYEYYNDSVELTLEFDNYELNAYAGFTDGKLDTLSCEACLWVYEYNYGLGHGEWLKDRSITLDYSATDGVAHLTVNSGILYADAEITINSTEITATVHVGNVNYSDFGIDADIVINSEGISVVGNYIEEEQGEKAEGVLIIDETQIKLDFDFYEYDSESSTHYAKFIVDVLINEDGVSALVSEKNDDLWGDVDWLVAEAEFTEGGIVGNAEIATKEYDWYSETYVELLYVAEFSLENGALSILVTEGDSTVADLEGTLVIDETGIEYAIVGEVLVEEFDYESYEYVKVLVPIEQLYVLKSDRISEKSMFDGEGYGYEILFTEDGIEFSYIMDSYDYAEEEIKRSEILAKLDKDSFDCELIFDEELIGEICLALEDGFFFDAWINSSLSDKNLLDIAFEITEEENAEGVKTTLTFDIENLPIETYRDLVAVEYVEYDEYWGYWNYIYKRIYTYVIANGSITVTHS